MDGSSDAKGALIPLSDPGDDDPMSSGVDLPRIQPNARYLTWGIFEVTYDGGVPRPLFFFRPTPSEISRYREPFLSFLRLLKDLWSIAQWQCLEYYLYMFWMVISPATSMYSLSCSLQSQEDLIKDVQILALAWLFCGLMSYRVENTLIESRLKIGGRLRQYFIPKIVQASLEWDQDNLRESSVYFPYATSYGDFVPAWDFFEVTFMRLRHILVIVLEILAMISIISQQENSNIRLFSLLTVSFLTITFLSLTNGGAERMVHYSIAPPVASHSTAVTIPLPPPATVEGYRVVNTVAGSLTLKAQVFTGLRQIRSMALGHVADGGDKFLIAGANVDGGVAVFQRINGGRNLTEVARNVEIANRTSFVFV
ncbi:hypothetical protein BDZ97DRAFT_1929515 [Flammula alnicola]|nr:hypothetical protein BDZ97DRAFT_1929515 [Flammula alnicola]